MVQRMGRPQRKYTVDDYFTIEAMSEVKHEFYNGEIFAMAGASAAHNDITANVLARLRIALRRQGCRAYGSDFRVQTPAGLLTYPDVSVFCGPLAFVRGRDDTATNPALLVEVLSDATRDYDRGEKLSLYRSIPSLREYLLVEQAAVRVEHWVRGHGSRWTAASFERLDDLVRLVSVPVTLRVSEVYREVFARRRSVASGQPPRRQRR
jgi:Uma2 family endonuclease